MLFDKAINAFAVCLPLAKLKNNLPYRDSREAKVT